jgi:ABC-type glycerol-3-phosphate transport system substrate-binding protein
MKLGPADNSGRTTMSSKLQLLRRWRVLGLFLAVSALAALMAASISQASRRDTVTVTFQEQFGDAESVEMGVLVKQFEAANPTIHIQLVRDNDSSYYDKLVTQIIGGGGPDIARVEPPKAVQYITAQYVAPLDQWFPKSARSQFFPSTVGPLVRGGKLYGLPQDVATLVLFYRTDLFKAAGITHAPTTWPELAADAKKLTTAGRYGIGLFGGWGAFEFYPWLWESGAQVLKPNGDKMAAAFNSPAGVSALQFWTNLENQKLMPPGAATLTEDDVKGPFIAGKLAMFTSGPWSVGSLKTAGIKGKWSVAPLPKGKTRASVLGGLDVVVLNNSKHKAEAAKFLAWLYQDKIQSGWDRALGFIPVKKTLYATPAFKNNPLSKQFYASLQISRSRPVVPQAAQVDNALGQAVQSALSGAQTPQAALDAAAKTANDALSH